MNVIPLGPINPIFKEPIRIKLIVEGEIVIGAEIEMGYVHRGIERIIEGKHYLKGIHLAERVCGICSYIHTQTFVECIEKISNIEVPDKAKYLRVIVTELERIQSHILAVSMYGMAIEHETLAIWCLNIREKVMDLLETVTGNRINMGFNLVGGVRMDINREMVESIYSTLDSLEEDLEDIMEIFKKGPLISLRSKGIGVIGYKEIMKTRAVGPVARASALPESDWRLRHPIYRELNFKPVWAEEGDNYARALVRLKELFVSIELVRRALELYEESSGMVRKKVDIRGGSGEWRNEAHRGEVTYKISITDGGIIKRILIRSPTVMNLSAYKYMLKTCPTVSDAVATYVSIDPCVSCTERSIVLLDRRTGEVKPYFK